MWVPGQGTFPGGWGRVLQVALLSFSLHTHEQKSTDLNTGGASQTSIPSCLQTTMVPGSSPELSCSH